MTYAEREQELLKSLEKEFERITKEVKENPDRAIYYLQKAGLVDESGNPKEPYV